MANNVFVQIQKEGWKGGESGIAEEIIYDAQKESIYVYSDLCGGVPQRIKHFIMCKC